MAPFKALKLNAVYEALNSQLRASAPSGATVQEVAGQWGFTHTGNFAADYRHLFGELPSETSARRSKGRGQALAR